MIQNIPQDKGILFSLSKLRESVWGSTYFPINEPNTYSRAHLWPILYIAGMLGLWGENCQNMT